MAGETVAIILNLLALLVKSTNADVLTDGRRNCGDVTAVQAHELERRKVFYQICDVSDFHVGDVNRGQDSA